jgi:hypothetical protein
MSYTLVNPPTVPVAAAEAQVTLDTGQTVLIAASNCRVVGNCLCVRADARCVDAQGVTLNDGNGHAIVSTAHGNFAPEIVDAIGVPALTKDITLLAIGEPVTATLNGVPVVTQDPSVLASYSIRAAIAAGAHSGPVTDLGALL